ncbi:MAG: glycoside hydrolase family 140 protein [Lewinellaceae bacterium]|nr:glycoside hydrolase family 140 protein [Lewinellaceae bacterium]
MLRNLSIYIPALVFSITICACTVFRGKNVRLTPLRVSANKHNLEDGRGKPFFWLGDTGWLLFSKLNREEAETYLDNRAQNGFNVIQVMLIHDLSRAVNVYGDSAFFNNDITRPVATAGNAFDDTGAYDYWDHVDYIVRLADKKGIYMAMVPLWGSNVKRGAVTREMAEAYGQWLAARYRFFPNVIWLNGGDIFGTDSIEVWKALGNALHKNDPGHLITFHPRGRTQSSMWFHNEPWLDFNMVQSGHRRYDQDDTALAYGEDNWRYIQSDYTLAPVKPVIDGEPSYEGIPQGLHDTLQPYWTDADVRRYAYWSVFAGAFGFTYGHSAVMQFYKPGETPAYGAKIYWRQALDAPGARQMKHLKALMLSRPPAERVPDQEMLAENTGERYDYLLATRGKDYVYVYTFTGRNIAVRADAIAGEQVKASWFNPRDGTTQNAGVFSNKGTLRFDPPGALANGNDWVLILESIEP